MNDQERPVHVAYDCSTGERVDTPFTDEEWEEHKARESVAEQEEQERTAARDRALAAVQAKAAEDPAFAALATLMGVSL